MADNILDSITEQYHSLTKSGKKLADYVFSHTAETQYLSITSLAENCDVSEATITRFCRGLGLSGYNAFKLALAQADRMTDLGDSGNSAEPVSSEDSITTIAAKVHAANIISLNESYELFDEKTMTQAVSILSKARRIYCFGQGGSMVMAMEAWARFQLLLLTLYISAILICRQVQFLWQIPRMRFCFSLTPVLPKICVIL